MPRITIVYGLLDRDRGQFLISFPDAPGCAGRGNTREAAIIDGERRLRDWVAAGNVLEPRTTTELGWDEGVELALKLGWELVAVPI